MLMHINKRKSKWFNATIALTALILSPKFLSASESIYWTEGDPVAPRIMKANLDGSSITTVMTTSSSENGFGGIAFDVANGQFYSGTRNFLFRANLDGSGRVNLVPTTSQNS